MLIVVVVETWEVVGMLVGFGFVVGSQTEAEMSGDVED